MTTQHLHFSSFSLTCSACCGCGCDALAVPTSTSTDCGVRGCSTFPFSFILISLGRSPDVGGAACVDTFSVFIISSSMSPRLRSGSEILISVLEIVECLRIYAAFLLSSPSC